MAEPLFSPNNSRSSHMKKDMLNYSSFLSFVRNRLFRTTKSRRFFKYGNFFLKIYDSPEEAKYEYMVLRKIEKEKPVLFSVPKPLKLIEDHGRSILVLKFVKGYELQAYIDRYLLFKDSSTIQIFRSLGRALREFHGLDVSGLHDSSFPTSEAEIREEIKKVSKQTLNRVLNADCRHLVCDQYSHNLDNRLFECVNLVGECYFTHVLVSCGKFIFLDLHESRKGPLYYDLATFNISLYGSLLLPKRSVVTLAPLIEAFLGGYFNEDVPLKPLKLAELYLVLKTIEMFEVSSLKVKLIAILKERKLKEAIEKMIIPQLIS